MSTTRREFLTFTAGTGAYLTFAAAGVRQLAAQSAPTQSRPAGAARPRTILILGGTGFLGPQIVEAARARGHTVTLFNRGKTNPHLFPDIEKLHGDRDGDLKALEGRKWDAVVDTSGYVPRVVKASADLLRDAVAQYVFISTISVYSDTSKPGMDEATPVGKLADETVEKIDGATYGPLKALCEQAAEKALPGRVTNIRPGLIVGPGDPSDRFTYWPVRVARGGDVLAPGTPDDPVQYIDARDLGAWIVKAIEDHTRGVFNAVGPQEPLGMGALLKACKSVAGSNAEFTFVPAEFLEAQKVAAWSDMPAWVPPIGENAGSSRVSAAQAIAKGLTFRPVDATVRDTLAWFRAEPAERQAKLRAGISPEREQAVLVAWRKR